MKITPLDIQHKVFGLQLRGYHRQQVDQFLETLAETVEELIKENGALKERLTQKEEEIQALKKKRNVAHEHPDFHAKLCRSSQARR
ncbi:MAG: DivIVA domain-containing protein [Nitrospirae bacterium]|nr:MAG: DivIVA domain-containing protein [Nitrospirota bacterium]